MNTDILKYSFVAAVLAASTASAQPVSNYVVPDRTTRSDGFNGNLSDTDRCYSQNDQAACWRAGEWSRARARETSWLGTRVERGSTRARGEEPRQKGDNEYRHSREMTLGYDVAVQRSRHKANPSAQEYPEIESGSGKQMENNRRDLIQQ